MYCECTCKVCSIVRLAYWDRAFGVVNKLNTADSSKSSAKFAEESMDTYFFLSL